MFCLYFDLMQNRKPRFNFSEKVAQINVTEEFAIQALAKICQLGLEPSPEIYALWYSYYKEDDCDLRKKIDHIISSHESVSDHHFQSVLSTMRKDNVALQEFQHDITNVIDETLSNAVHISDNAKDLGEYIDEITNNETIDTKEVILEISNKARTAMQINSTLTEKLAEQQNMVANIQEDYRRVREELITDGLTKIHNRRYLDERLPQLIEKATQSKKNLSVLMFDIDHFKKFNDTHGHQVGDTVLKFVGHTMKSLFPNITDCLFRYGGEEFVIIFERNNKFEAQKFATQLMNTIAKKDIILKSTKENIGNVTISGGVAELTPKDNAMTIIERADFALYDSKKNGRNRMTIASSI